MACDRNVAEANAREGELEIKLRKVKAMQKKLLLDLQTNRQELAVAHARTAALERALAFSRHRENIGFMKVAFEKMVGNYASAKWSQVAGWQIAVEKEACVAKDRSSFYWMGLVFAKWSQVHAGKMSQRPGKGKQAMQKVWQTWTRAVDVRKHMAQHFVVAMAQVWRAWLNFAPMS